MYDAKWYKHLWLFVNNIFSSRHTMLRKQWLHYEKIQLLKADITNSMTQNPPWWANTHSASQQILCLLWTYLFSVVQITAYYQNLTQITLIHSHTQKMEAYSSIHIPPQYWYQSEKKLLHTTIYICCSPVFKISFNIICQVVLPFQLFNYNSVNISPSLWNKISTVNSEKNYKIKTRIIQIRV